MPRCSIASSVARRPAVSASSTGQPPSAVWKATTSRVVPGVLSTIAREKPQSALSKRLLPTLGRPAMTTFHPESSRSPTAPRSMSASRRARATAGSCSTRMASRAISVAQGAVDLVEQDFGRQHRRGKSKVFERLGRKLSHRQGSRTPESPSAGRAVAPARSSDSSTDSHSRCPAVTLNLDGRNRVSSTTATTSSPSPAPIRPSTSRPGTLSLERRRCVRAKTTCNGLDRARSPDPNHRDGATARAVKTGKRPVVRAMLATKAGLPSAHVRLLSMDADPRSLER